MVYTDGSPRIASAEAGGEIPTPTTPPSIRADRIELHPFFVFKISILPPGSFVLDRCVVLLHFYKSKKITLQTSLFVGSRSVAAGKLQDGKGLTGPGTSTSLQLPDGFLGGIAKTNYIKCTSGRSLPRINW